MCACVGKNLGLASSLKMEEEEAMLTKKQGIISILGSDSDRSSNRSAAAASHRRTLSADMSSKTWLSQNGFLSPMKKIASSEEFPVSDSISEIDSSSSSSSSEDGEEGENESRSRFDIWASIQEEKNKSKETEKHGQFDVWSSILSQKAKEDSVNKQLPPYVHPLVKRSVSSLSEKSLEVCTESLGSETGSDGFSSYPSSETGDIEEDKEDSNSIQDKQEPLQKQEERALGQDEPVRVVKYSYLGAKKSSQRSFPPPISSLSCRDGASTYMKTRRDNGRLVLEAVSVPSKNNFCAQRQDGRLVLTFANSNDTDGQEEEENQERRDKEKEEEELESSDEEREKSEEDEEEMQEEEDGDEAEEEEKTEMGFMMEQAPKFTSGLMTVHRLALMVNKPTGLANKNPTWPNKFNEIVKLKGEEDDGEEVVMVKKSNPPTSLAQSLPPRPPLVARLIPSSPQPPPQQGAASFNAYEYYWRSNPISKNLVSEEQQQQFVVLRRKKQEGGDELVPFLEGCKEQRRSLLFWEPYCVVTS